MNLPENQVGISDIENYRECPARFAFGMRRHNTLPPHLAVYEGQKDEPPEAPSYAAEYGHAIHDAIKHVEDDQCSDDEAIDRVWAVYGNWLEPADIDRLKSDLRTYRTRAVTGYRLVGAEIELKMPLLKIDGETIYFRARIDVLYQHLQNPGIFLSRDYKSSRWPKSRDEIDADVQQWAYNAVIHYNYPECEDLTQIYDQLRYGEEPIHKSAAQRSQIYRWLQMMVKKILADDVLEPKKNDKCHWCPLMMDCPVTHRASAWWKSWLAANAPEKKDGRKLIVQLDVDHTGLEFYVEKLPDAKLAVKMLERYVATVEDALKGLPQGEREQYGYGLTKGRSNDRFEAQALRTIADMTGDDFYHLASLSKKAVNEFYGEDSADAQRILALATKRESAPSLKAL